VLSIYNLRTLELIKELEPGTDGHLQWNMDNNILHTYGCGSGCMEAKLYSVKGETLFSEEVLLLKCRHQGGFLRTSRPTGLVLRTFNSMICLTSTW
jgi:hypothetical protein